MSAVRCSTPRRGMPTTGVVSRKKGLPRGGTRMDGTPPGPSGLLTILRLVRRVGADPLEGFLDLARTHGDLVMLRPGPIRFCLINHPELVREVLVIQAKNFRKPERLKRNLAKVVGNGLL